MRKAFCETPDAADAAVAIRRNMADAVSYLTRVAEEAGMRTIAFKLDGVRLALLDAAAADPAEPDPGESDPAHPRRNPEDAADERGKLS